MKYLLMLVLLAGCGESSTSGGSLKAPPDPVVAHVTDPSREVQELRAHSFQLEVFEDGPAKLSLEAKNDRVSLILYAVLADTWSEPFKEAMQTGGQDMVLEIVVDGALQEASQGEVHLKIMGLQLDGAFDVLIGDKRWTAKLEGPVKLLCHVKGGQGGAPVGGSPSWWLDVNVESAFCKNVFQGMF